MTVTTTGTTRELASLLSDLRFEDLPRELEDKARRLAGLQDGASPEEIRQIIDRVWTLDREPDVRDLLPGV
jgi:hypothetical protein